MLERCAAKLMEAVSDDEARFHHSFPFGLRFTWKRSEYLWYEFHQFDGNSNTGTADCETDLDSAADDGYYAARVGCTVQDSNGNTVASGGDSDDGDYNGYAAVSLTFAATPGVTYTVIGGHSAGLTVPFDTPEGEPSGYSFDEYNFENYIESPNQEVADNYDWYGPGPEEQTRQKVLTLPQTKARGTAPQTPGALSVISFPAVTYKTPYTNGCPLTAPYGVSLMITYQVLDNTSQHNAVSSSTLEPQEQSSNLVINGTPSGSGAAPNWTDIGPSNYPDGSVVPGTTKYTNAQGQFLDAPFALCSNASLNSSATVTQAIRIMVSGSLTYVVRTNNWTVTSNSIGHGSMNNGNDITITF